MAGIMDVVGLKNFNDYMPWFCLIWISRADGASEGPDDSLSFHEGFCMHSDSTCLRSQRTRHGGGAAPSFPGWPWMDPPGRILSLAHCTCTCALVGDRRGAARNRHATQLLGGWAPSLSSSVSCGHTRRRGRAGAI